MKNWHPNCHTLVRLSAAFVLSSALNLEANACLVEQERQRNGCAVSTSREDAAGEASVELQDGNACKVEGSPISDDDTQAAVRAALTGSEDRFDEGQEGEGWRVIFQPYIWALGNEVRIATEQFDRSDYTGYIDALLNQYQYGFLWSTVAYKGNWGIYMDGHFVRLKDDGKELGLPYTSDVRQMLFEAAILRRFGSPRAYLELLAGARYFSVKSDVDVTLVGGFNDLFAWFEPMAGMRLGASLDEAELWRAEISADAGGFELGSDFTWQVTGSITRQLSERRSISLGYRHIDIEYFDSPNRYESEMSGPFLGFGFNF